ncbi:BQ2448_7223 [Microbotryum intermedium]|uniref:BQ2448_7223 protein n=1 Tax=Microbotryum intermedium TaxID=269621 RepID=A0A238FJ78_9BASI|nr:BQ2448_7223 [Microbotryum intermedium]
MDSVRTTEGIESPAGTMMHPEASEEAQIVFLELEAGQAALCRRCWDKTAFSQLVHCSKACHFCRTCVRQHARLGYSATRYWLGCICAEGKCHGRLSQSDLGKFLPRGLEWCPLCPFATIVEDGLQGPLVCSGGCGTWDKNQSRPPIFIADMIVTPAPTPAPMVVERFECRAVANERQTATSDSQDGSKAPLGSSLVATNKSTSLASASTSSSEPLPPYVPKTLECACCFDDDPLLETTKCSNGCVFCLDCARKYAETRIEECHHTLPCMSTTPCQGVFIDAEAILFLPRTSFARLEQLRQDYEIERAQIPGLEKCPFCPYAVILDPHHGRIFQCLMPDCAISSCRRCLKEDHSPMTCKEAAEHKPARAIHKVAGQHSPRFAVDEAMSDALIRKCPNIKCAKTYIKEEGCNHIICTACRTESCFVCGVIVGRGGFSNGPLFLGYGHWKPPSATCPLFDDGDMKDRVSGNIESAWRSSASLVLQEHPEIDECDLESLRLLSKWNPSTRHP